jgi:hypothetical protein
MGFEFRMQHRLHEGARGRTYINPLWNLTGGFAAVGLGVAAAFFIAVFVFDFSFTGTSRTQIANNSATETVVPPQVATGQASLTGSPERTSASDYPQQDALTSAVKDSTPARKGTLPEGKYQVVDGSGR